MFKMEKHSYIIVCLFILCLVNKGYSQDTLKIYSTKQAPFNPTDYYSKCKPCYEIVYIEGFKYKEYLASTDCLIGSYIEYYPDVVSKYKITGQYQKVKSKDECSVKVGTWKYYNKKGKIFKEEFYNDKGKLIKIEQSH